VNGLIVEADAVDAREAIGELRRRPRSKSTENVCADIIEFLVEIPGWTLRRIAAIASATTRPARVSPSRSSCDSIDIAASYGLACAGARE
jgi:hypothetical protein